MKTLYPLFTILCLAMFIGCAEELPVQQYEGPNAEAYIKNLEQPILFQIVQLDENEEWESGWVIDDKGNIHVFSIDGRLAENQENMDDCPGTFVMESLLNYTDGIVGQVDLDELADKHRSLKAIKQQGTSKYIPNDANRLAFYGLLKTKRAETYVNNGNINNGNCDGDGSTSFGYHTLDYIVLDKRTPEGERSNHASAKNIVEWMKVVDQEL